MYALKKITLLYILVLPLTSAFAVNIIYSFPILISSILFLYYTILLFLFRIKLHRKGIELLMFAGIIMISFLINDVGSKSVNHLGMYMMFIFCSYFGVRNSIIAILIKDRDYINKVYKTLSLTVFIASFFAIIEFLLKNFFSIEVSNYISYALSEYDALSSGFYRARSFMEESGHFILFLECCAPISIYYIFKLKNIGFYTKALYLSIIIFSIIVTFSSIGYILLLVLCLLLFYLFIKHIKNLLLKGLILFISALFFHAYFIDFMSFVFFTLEKKMMGSDSYEYRASRVIKGISYLKDDFILLGYGPASYDTLEIDSYISFYITVLMDFGVVGVGFYLCFLLWNVYYIIKIKDNILKNAFLLSFLLASFHYYYVGNYYYPWYWFMLGLLYIEYIGLGLSKYLKK